MPEFGTHRQIIFIALWVFCMFYYLLRILKGDLKWESENIKELLKQLYSGFVPFFFLVMTILLIVIGFAFLIRK